MRAVDTNVLVRLIVRDDARQVAVAEDFLAQGGWVSTLALAEAVWVLDAVYLLSAAEISTVIEMLLENKNLSLEDRALVARALDLFRSRPSLGFPDCLMLETARSAGHLPVGTFDRRLGRVDGAQKL